mmetsp:Transcript_24767/g.42699  ORF Transcript_24767/g.42699 Transcript_24767/m.42699 type:complete len:432 (-) Transcript_24767:202-1497(-)
MVLLVEVLHVAFANVRLNEVGVELRGLVTVLLGELELPELLVRGRAVAIEHRLGRVPPDRLRVVLDRVRVVAVLERLVAHVLLLGGDLGAQVRLLVPLALDFLDGVQLVRNVLGLTLHERLLEVLDRVLQVVHLLVRAPHPPQRLCDVFVVAAVGLDELDGLLTVGDAVGVVGGLEVDGGAVQQERLVRPVQLDRLVVVRHGLVEVLFLVRLVALLLLLQRLPLQPLLLRRRLRRRRRLRLRALGRRLAGLLRLGRLGRAGLLEIHEVVLVGELDVGVDPHQDHHGLQHTPVRHGGAEVIRIRPETVEFGEEGRVARVLGRLRVLHQPAQRVRRRERVLVAREGRPGHGRVGGVVEALLELLVVRVVLQAVLVALDRLLELAEPMQRESFAGVPLAPIGLQRDRFFGILESLVVLLQTCISGRAIAVKNMI